MRRHFHTFDAIRFFAFFKVFLLHLPITSFPIFTFIKNGGGIGVSLFFVLSGFLITYIILEEKKIKGQLNLYHFFVRRILRIWPLYYLMIAFAYVTPYLLHILKLPSSASGYEPTWWMSLTFLENYKMMQMNNHPNVSPLSVMWSLCIEEHFYIFWGILLYFSKTKHLPAIFLSLILISNIANILYIENNILLSDLITNLNYFVFGALPAFLLNKNTETFELLITNIRNPYKYLVIILVLFAVFIIPNYTIKSLVYFEPMIFGLLFSLLITLIIPLKNNFRICDKNILSKLGLYTYGLYLYHTIILNLLFHIFNNFRISLASPINAILFFTISLGTTIGISILSYHLFEKQFLKLKRFFV